MFQKGVIPAGWTRNPCASRSSATARWAARWRRLAAERGHVVHAIVSREENLAGRALTRDRLDGRRRRDRVHPSRCRRRQPRAADRGRHPDRHRNDRLGGRAAAHRPPGRSPPRRAAPRRQLLRRRPPLPPRRPGSRRALRAATASSTPLYWRSTTPRRSTRRPAPRSLLREQAARGRSRAGLSDHIDPRRRDPGHARASPTTARTRPSALSHAARSRRGFAAGALAAAEWLPGHPGVHGSRTMLFGGAG